MMSLPDLSKTAINSDENNPHHREYYPELSSVWQNEAVVSVITKNQDVAEIRK